MKIGYVIKKLKECGIDFYITGSFAVNLYTNSRDNSDIDFAVKRSDLDKVQQIFRGAKVYYLNKKGYRVKSIKFSEYEFSAYDNFPMKVSLEVNDKRLKSCLMFKVDGQVCDVISAEELILLKLLLNRNSGTKMDNHDIKLLLRTQKINYMYLFMKALRGGVFGKLLHIFFNRNEGNTIDGTILRH